MKQSECPFLLLPVFHVLIYGRHSERGRRIVSEIVNR